MVMIVAPAPRSFATVFAIASLTGAFSDEGVLLKKPSTSLVNVSNERYRLKELNRTPAEHLSENHRSDLSCSLFHVCQREQEQSCYRLHQILRSP